MKGMYRIALCALLAAAAFAQTDVPPPEKPPVDVDQALRDRATEFYTLLKNQEYRKAEALVAEDTKDYYYAGPKPEIHNFEIVGIEYSEHFTHATVTTKCTEPVVVAGFPPSVLTLKIPTLWKVENGLWVVYEDPEKIHSPGGLQRKIDVAISGAVAATMPTMPKDLPKDASSLFGKVQLERPEMELKSGESQTVAIYNGAPGPITLELGYPLKGIETKLDRTDLTAGQKAILTMTAGKEPVGGPYSLRVMPTGEILNLKVIVK